MAQITTIEWTDATWNPVTGCTKVSPGCDHCYAERIVDRFRGKGAFGIVRYSEEKLYLPLSWRRPRRVFVNSMSDLFHDRVPTPFIHRVWSVMARTPQHTYQVLTKRHGRMRTLIGSPDARRVVADIVGADIPWPLPNVWLGVSAEDQQRANLRIPALIDTPAAVRWVSAEPLLGPIDLNRTDKDALVDGGLDWVVVGGESGPGARPMDPGWVRALRNQCVDTVGVAFFFKQWGEWAPNGWRGIGNTNPRERLVGPELDDMGHREVIERVGKRAAGRVLDGRTWDEYPGQRRPVRSTLTSPVTAGQLAKAGIDPAGHVAAGLADGTR